MLQEPLSSCSVHPGSPETWQPETHSTVRHTGPAACTLLHTTHSRLSLTSRVERSRTSHLDVPDLQGHGSTLRADNVFLSSLSHLCLKGLKLTVNVWKPSPSRTATLHLKQPEDTRQIIFSVIPETENT